MKKVKTVLKVLAVLLVFALVVIQFFGIDKSSPATVQADTIGAAVTVPANVNAILEKSCNDCHTNSTVYPWYANVQPFGWFLKNHIDDGRRHLNLSQFGTYASNRKVKKLEEMCEQVQKREMPLPSYLWIHRDSVLSDADIQTLCSWTEEAKAKFSE
jgi:hypothetical protein